MYTAQIIYPWTGAGEDTNCFELQDTLPAPLTPDLTTTLAFGTNTTLRWELVKPFTANATGATPAAGQFFGWTIKKANMNNTSLPPNKRVIVAGTWTFQGTIVATIVDAVAETLIRVYIHKRNTNGTLTLIAQQDSAAFAITLLTTTWSFTWAGTEILFDTDETLHLEFWVQQKGNAITAQTITFSVGQTAALNTLQVSLPSPGLRTRWFRDIIATMAGIVVAIIKTLFKTMPVTTTGTPVMTRVASLKRTLGVTATGSAAIVKQLFKTLAVTMASTVQALIQLPFAKLPAAGGGNTYSRSRVDNK